MSLRNNGDINGANNSIPSIPHLIISHQNETNQKNILHFTGQQPSSSLYQETNKKEFQQHLAETGEEQNAFMINNLAEIYPQYDKNKNYYQEFWKIYLHNEILIGEMKEQANEIKNLKSKISHTEDLHKQLSNTKASRSPYKKKNRRTADEIMKDYLCPYPKCNKTYGSDVSLNLHIKLKHDGGNKTEREKLARSIIMAEINGEEPPAITLNLPPGYLEKFKDQNTKRMKKNKNEDDSQQSFKNFDDYDEDAIFRELKKNQL